VAVIRVDIQDREFRAALEKVLADLTDMRELWRMMPAAYAEAERSLFATDGFGRWPAHSPDYEMSKWKREHSPGQMLVGTGYFRGQMLSPAARTDYRDRTVFQAWSPLANIHQYRRNVKNAAGTFPLKHRGQRKLYPVSNRLFKGPFEEQFVKWGKLVVERDWEA
jgi:hypothetical protein